MNPLFLLLGLFGGALALGSSSSTGSTVSTSDGKVADDNPDQDPTDGDDGGMDAGGDDGHDHGDGGGMDAGGDDGDDSDGGGMDTGGDDGHDHGGHGDHSTPELTPPGVGASQSEINAYVQALGELDEMHVHDSGSSKAGEHDAAMGLVERSEATHVAIGDGDWFDPNIWSNGEVPGDNAKVLIPEGVTVDYGGVSDASLFTVRIDGALDFATDENSQMIFDTMVTSPTGHLIIGTANNPIDADVDVDLIVADNGRIDTDWDPFLLSRGIVAHGTTTIHGATKDSHEKVTDDPMEGDTSIKFAEVPEGWQVGDTIVIAGTHFDGYKWDNDIDGKRLYPPEDEERVITSIDDDGRIHFDEPLVHDHDTPRDDLFTSVANYTRNISVESENADELEVFERGHVMFMHSDNVDVRYAEFHELGRTDKSVESRDISNIDNISFDSNIQGRYSLHLHRTGTSDLENPAILEGNAVYGSPGWGVVHHDSNAVITNNATYDTFGAAYVAETGNETGLWDDNIAIWAEGVSWGTPKQTSEIGDNIFDTARGGEGFWFQGRMVASTNNVAASVNNGFAYFHRDGDDRMIEFDASLFDFDAALDYSDDVTADDVPILGFQNNEAFAVNQGLHIVKANPNQGHDVWSHLDDFTAWSVQVGAHIEYTAHYLLTNFDIVGKEDTPFSEAETGILLGNNVSEIVIIDPKIDSFETGIDLNKNFIRSDWEPELHNYVVINPEITNVDQAYENRTSLDRIYDDINDLPNLDVDLQLDELSYTHSSNYSDSVVNITGTKTDTLGSTDFPGGTDTFKIQRGDVINILEEKGYWTTSSGDDYFLVDIFLTDRVTGEIFYETHPVYIEGNTLSLGSYSGAQLNGTQNITSQGGQQFAGDQLLNTPIPATPTSGSTITQETIANGALPDSVLASQTLAAVNDSMDHEASMTLSAMPMDMGDDIVLQSDDGDQGVEEDDTAAPAADDAADASEESRTMAIFNTLALQGLEGEDESEDEATETDENDEDDATQTISLAGLSADQASAFTLLSADEISSIFDEAVEGGLGAMDAKIIIDYDSDSVSLELSEGDGTVKVETCGIEVDETGSVEDMWAALTSGQGIITESACTVDDDEEDHMHDVAA